MDLAKLRQTVKEIAQYAEAFKEMDDFLTLLAQRVQVAKDLETALAALNELNGRIAGQREALMSDAAAAQAERQQQAEVLTKRMAEMKAALEAELERKRAATTSELRQLHNVIDEARLETKAVRDEHKTALGVIDGERREALAAVERIKSELASLRERVGV